MRILHLNAKADCGGAEVMILAFLARSRDRGDVTAVAMAPGAWEGRFRDAADAWHELPLVERSPGRLPRFAREIRRVVRDFRPDVIHAHNPTMMLGAAAATAGMRGIRLVGTLHGNMSGDYRREALICRVFRGPITVVTPFIVDELAGQGVRDVLQIQNGVPAAPAARTREEFAERFGLGGPGRSLLVGVGRLTDMKRWNLALDAVALVPEVDLVIFGEGPNRGDLEAQVEALGLGDRVAFPGVVDDVRSWTGAADAALTTSGGEGPSLAVLEFLAAGIPVVAADVPGINDTVDEASALMIDATDAEETATAIRTALAGGPGILERVAKGRVLAEAKSEERMVDRYFALYEGDPTAAAVAGDAAGAGPGFTGPGIFHDWRWNGVTTMRAIEIAAGGRAPGFGDDPEAVRRERDAITRLLLSRIPIAAVDFVELGDCRERDRAYLLLHRCLADRGGLGLERALIADCGRYVGIAVPHTLGDHPTYSPALGPFTARAADVPCPSPMLPFDSRPMPSILWAATTSLMKNPTSTVRAAKEVLADERAASAAAESTPAPRTAGARPRYCTGRLLWKGEGRPPRAIALGREWRAALEEGLGSGVLHPGDAWVIVGLRAGSPGLAGRGGNFLSRIRMPLTDDHAADVAATMARIRSPFPLMRTALSAVPQQVRQLLGRGDRHPSPSAFPMEQEAPVEGLATSWTYNRLDVDSVWEASSTLVGPGVISANVYESPNDMYFVMSAFVDDVTWEAAVAATWRVLADAGWESRRRSDDAGGGA